MRGVVLSLVAKVALLRECMLPRQGFAPCFLLQEAKLVHLRETEALNSLKPPEILSLVAELTYSREITPPRQGFALCFLSPAAKLAHLRESTPANSLRIHASKQP